MRISDLSSDVCSSDLVLGDDFCRLMLMASVAGVLLVIVIQVTGRAGCIVIAVEQEITAVVECCRLPVHWLVTRRTGQGLAAMPVIARGHVTGLAVRERVGFQPGVIKSDCADLGQPRSRVIAVAGHALVLGLLMMESRPPFRLHDLVTLGCATDDYHNRT